MCEELVRGHRQREDERTPAQFACISLTTRFGMCRHVPRIVLVRDLGGFACLRSGRALAATDDSDAPVGGVQVTPAQPLLRDACRPCVCDCECVTQVGLGSGARLISPPFPPPDRLAAVRRSDVETRPRLTCLWTTHVRASRHPRPIPCAPSPLRGRRAPPASPAAPQSPTAARAAPKREVLTAERTAPRLRSQKRARVPRRADKRWLRSGQGARGARRARRGRRARRARRAGGGRGEGGAARGRIGMPRPAASRISDVSRCR